RIVRESIPFGRQADKIEIHFAVNIGIVEDGDGIGSGGNVGEIAYGHIVMLPGPHAAKFFRLVAREPSGRLKSEHPTRPSLSRKPFTTTRIPLSESTHKDGTGATDRDNASAATSNSELFIWIGFTTIADDRKSSLGVRSSAVFQRGRSVISIGTGSEPAPLWLTLAALKRP